MNSLKILALLLLSVPSSWGEMFGSSQKGTTTAGFLKLGVGARGMAMGEAYSAVADEASALYWNPAALTQIEKRSLTFMHAAYIDDSFFDYAAYGHNMGERGAFGLGIHYLTAGKIPETDITGTDVAIFNPYDIAISAGYAYRLGMDGMLNGLSLGLSAKFIQSKIITEAQTGAVDIGVLSPGYMDDKLRLAFSAMNLGGQIKFDEAKENLPMALRLGSHYKIRPSWGLSLDVTAPRDNQPHVGVGAEYMMQVRESWTVAGRLGFNSRTIGDVDGFTGASFGVGLGFQKMSVDYAFLPFGSLGMTHRASLSFKF